MFLDEWNALFSLRVNVTPIIKLKLFGNNYTLPFPHLVDINTNVYMSVGGKSHSYQCFVLTLSQMQANVDVSEAEDACEHCGKRGEIIHNEQFLHFATAS